MATYECAGHDAEGDRKVSDWPELDRMTDDLIETCAEVKPSPAVSRSGEQEAREYELRMDFENWFERTEGVPYITIRDLRAKEISELVARFASHVRAQERERCKRIAERVLAEEQNIANVQFDAQLTGIGAARKIAATIDRGE